MNKDSKSQPVVIKNIKHGEKTEEKIPLSNPLCVPYIPVTVWYGTWLYLVWYLVLCSSNNDGYWQQQLSTHGDFHLDVARQYEKNCLMNMTHSKLLSWPDARSVKIIQTWAFYK